MKRRSEEHRREERTLLMVELAFQVPGDALHVAHARNVSIGGAFIETTSPAPYGTRLVVYLSLPGIPEMVEVPCVVRWASQTGMGVQFGSMGARETYALTLLMMS